MGKHIQIAPSILAADFARLGEEVCAAEAAGADVIHMDVMDGRFVPNITMGPIIVRAVRRVTRLPLDVHLMIVDPERYVAAFAEAGADALTIHPEATPHLHRALQQIRNLGVQAGVVLNPATPETVLRYVLPLLDGVLVMSVNPGFGGQAFIEETLSKISAVRQMLDAADSGAWVSVDGGITAATAPQVVARGATRLVAGSAIFGAPEGIAQAIASLRQSVA